MKNELYLRLLFFAAVFVSLDSTANSEILVLPNSESSFEVYQEACKKEGYVCTQQYFLHYFRTLETPLYDSFINELDLEDDQFISKLPHRVRTILESEMLSIEQVDSFISILDRAAEVQPKVNRFGILKIELSQLKEFVIRAEPTSESSHFIFKKAVGEIPATLLKTLSFKPTTRIIPYNGLYVGGTFLPFHEGTCEDSKIKSELKTYFQNRRFVFLKEKSCSVEDHFAEIFASSEEQRLYFDPNKKSEPSFLSRNKSAILWLSAAVGVGVLASQYEIKFEY